MSATDMQSANGLLGFCHRMQILICPSGQWMHQKSLDRSASSDILKVEYIKQFHEKKSQHL